MCVLGNTVTGPWHGCTSCAFHGKQKCTAICGEYALMSKRLFGILFCFAFVHLCIFSNVNVPSDI